MVAFVHLPPPPPASTQLAENSRCGSHEMEHLVMSLGGLQKYGEIRDVWRRNGGPKVSISIHVALAGRFDELFFLGI